MAAKALSAMDWGALYEHLAALRTELERVKRRKPIPMQRFRELRRRIAECTTEIARYHQRAAQDQAPPKGV
jgi:hypothetical protein